MKQVRKENVAARQARVDHAIDEIACVRPTHKIEQKIQNSQNFHNEQGLPRLDTHKDDGLVRKKVRMLKERVGIENTSH